MGFSCQSRPPATTRCVQARDFLIALACLIISTYSSVYSQPSQIGTSFRRISTEDGLSQGMALCMVQDHRGFMWIGTEDGLNRYDGYSFVTYRHNPLDSNSLSNSYIWTLHEDRTGLLWIGTWGGGLNSYDPSKNKFTRYQPNPSDSTSISHDRVTDITEDSLGNLWVCTAGGGINRFDRSSHQFTRLPRISSPPPANRPMDMFIIHTDRSGVLWIGTYYAGLLSYDSRTQRLQHFQADPANRRSISSNRVTAICDAGRGDLWFGTWGGGINLYHRASNTFEHFRNDLRDSTSLPGDIVRALKLDSNGNLWVGTMGAGLARFDTTTRRCIRYRNSPYAGNSLSGDIVCSIVEDAGGVLWFGTSDGISLSSPFIQKFPSFTHDPRNPEGLIGGKVFAMCRDSLGFIWIGTEDAGLNQFDPRTGHFRHYRYNSGAQGSLPHDQVTALMTDHVGDIWVGTYGGGVARFDRGNKRFELHTSDRAHPDQRINLWISSLAEDRKGNIWIGTWVEGLYVIDRSGSVLQRYRHDRGIPTSLPDDDVRCIVPDRAGSVWVGTARGGLARIDSLSGLFHQFRNDPANPASLSSDYIQTVFEDRSGNLWIGTLGGGFSRFDPRTGGCEHFGEQQGLLNNVVYGILEDDKGMLWISTNKGISCFNPIDASFQNYTRHDGLQADEFNFNAFCAGTGGKLFFGGVRGFNVVLPGQIQHNPHVPRMAITAFSIFNTAVNLDSILTSGGDIILDHSQNFFSIEYAALDYSLPARNTYAYMLEGLDESWVDAGTRRLAGYTNIAPGTYLFRARGANNDGVWNTAGTSIAITITPPFWRTLWFRILVLLVLIAAATMAYRLRVASILKVERMRLSIASDLHDDIGSSLASIAVLADLVRSRMNVTPAASAHLLDISRAARTTSDSLRDIVWFINPEHDFASDIIDHLQAIASRLLGGIDHTFRRDDLGTPVRLPMAFRRDVLLLYKEILSNIVRHAEATRVEICVGIQAGHLKLSVTDNGRGFNSSLPSNGNGLSTMRRRALQIGGTIEIHSEPKKGTAVTLEANIP
jgi:ligand-binding sensor domain-containing protein/signal transduction histidine kinase